MRRGIEERVASNTQRTRRVESNFLEVAESGSRSLTFTRNLFEVVSVEVELYKRDLNDSLISGHPDPAHGSGRGVSGDVRGEWTLVEDTTESEAFTKDGRNVLRDILDGDRVMVRRIATGADDEDATTGDSDLGDEYSRTFAYGSNDDNVATIGGSFRFHQTDEEAVEWGVLTDDDDLTLRFTTDDVSPSPSEEVRAVVSLTVEGSGSGNTTVTEGGEESVADAFTSDSVIGIDSIAFGEGTEDIEKTDTELTDRVFSKNVDRLLDSEVIRARTVVYTSEPEDEQPVDISEISVEDNEGRMLWAATFSAEEKNEDVRINVTVGFRLR